MDAATTAHGRPDCFWVPITAFPARATGLNRWRGYTDYGIGWLARAVDESCRREIR